MSDRIQYPITEDNLETLFNKRTEAALDFYENNSTVDYHLPLLYLHGAEYEGPCDAVIMGASFKQLAKIGHMLGLDCKQRAGWYGVASQLQLSHFHAWWIMWNIGEAEHGVRQLEELLAQC